MQLSNTGSLLSDCSVPYYAQSFPLKPFDENECVYHCIEQLYLVYYEFATLAKHGKSLETLEQSAIVTGKYTGSSIH